MIRLSGLFFAKDSSDKTEVVLALNHRGYSLIAAGEKIAEGTIDQLHISDRVGNIPRRVQFPDGALFETRENDALDAWLKNSAHSARGSLWSHRLETSWRWAAIGAIVTLLCSVAVVQWGIPTASKAIAFKIPVEASEYVSSQTLSTLDKFLLQPTELSLAEQARQRERFQQLISQADVLKGRYQLHFRKMPKDIPNAFALPGGDIIMTDGLISMSTHQQEIDSVLLHEIAHVENRHAQQQVVSSSIIAVASAYVTGGLVGSEELLTGLPVFLMQQSYSRKFELEADHFAFSQMHKLGLDPGCFATIISKITGIGLPEAGQQVSPEKSRSYLDSHPATTERARMALEYAAESGIQRVCLEQ